MTPTTELPDSIYLSKQWGGIVGFEPFAGGIEYTRKDKADAEIARLRAENKILLAFIERLSDKPITIRECME